MCDIKEGMNELGIPITGIRKAAFNLLNERIYSGQYTVKEVNVCFCGSKDLENISRFDRFGLPFGTSICRTCGLIMLNRVLLEDNLPSFYSDIYWPLVTGRLTEKYTTANKNSKNFIKYLSPSISNEALIFTEIGCGSGQKIVMLKNEYFNRNNAEFIGCDYSLDALKIAQKKGIKVINGGLEELMPKYEKKIDVLILSHVLEHFVNLKKALNTIDLLTHEGSLIYIEVPGIIDIQNKKRYSCNYQDYTVLAHIYNFSLTTLKNVFRSYGFEMLKGDEGVKAVFYKSSKKSLSGDEENDYNNVMNSLTDLKLLANKKSFVDFRKMKMAIRCFIDVMQKK